MAHQGKCKKCNTRYEWSWKVGIPLYYLKCPECDGKLTLSSRAMKLKTIYLDLQELDALFRI